MRKVRKRGLVLSDKGKKTHLKIRFCEKKLMSKKGVRNWNRKIRPKLHRYVYKPVLFLSVPVERLSSKEEICKLTNEVLWEGSFILMGYCGCKKTPTRVKLICLAKITVSRVNYENRSFVVLYNKKGRGGRTRLHRYWFWVGDKINRKV